LNLRFAHDIFPEIPAEKCRGVQVNSFSEYPRQLRLHFEKGKAGRMTLFKFHQNIYIAVGPQVTVKGGSENAELPYMVPATEIPDFPI
jgi:hypothetical protein